MKRTTRSMIGGVTAAVAGEAPIVDDPIEAVGRLGPLP